jgi:hypothetical protein
MKSYIDLIKSLDGKVFTSQTIDAIENSQKNLNFSEELKGFLMETNGMSHERFKILPLFDKNDPKFTWDSLERANDIATTKFGVDKELLEDFVVFAELEGLTCAMMSKKDGKIWYEDSEGFNSTSLTLEDFITNASKE